MIYFTADSHLDHWNIAKYCNRPFSSLEEMNETLIEKWNSVVKPEDEVWHLGDFCLGNQQKKVKYWLSRLNGKKNLVFGNHDLKSIQTIAHWESCQDYKELKIGNVYLILFHYALRTWRGVGRKNVYNLYGHSHGKLLGNSKQVDVGVDYPPWNYTPVNLEQILDHLKTLGEISNNE